MNKDNSYNSTDAEGFTSCTSEHAKRTANRVTLLRPPDRPGADVVRIRQDKLL